MYRQSIYAIPSLENGNRPGEWSDVRRYWSKVSEREFWLEMVEERHVTVHTSGTCTLVNDAVEDYVARRRTRPGARSRISRSEECQRKLLRDLAHIAARGTPTWSRFQGAAAVNLHNLECTVRSSLTGTVQ